MKKKFILGILSLLCVVSTCLTSCMKDGADGKDGINGVDGSAGRDGVDGKDGKDGTSIYTGSGAPESSLGKTGDLYVDSESGDLYSKGESGWIKTGNIKGAQGNDGTNGKDGVSIIGVSKTSASENVDTYTITYSDGTTSTFTVTNGVDGKPGVQGEKGEDGHTPTITVGSNGNWYVDGVDTGYQATGPKGDAGVNGTDGVSIVSVVKTDSNGEIDTYTITYSDGSISTFTIRNGKDGSDGHTPSVTIGSDGYWYVDGVNTGVSSVGIKGDKGDAGKNGNDGVSVVETHIDENGDLICEMSDGTTINAGHVKDVTKHTVNFYVDDDLVYKTTVEDGGKVAEPDESYTAGYTVNYWNSKEDGGYRWLFSAYTVTSDMNLYADFSYNDYTITYVDEKYGTSLESLAVTYDKEYTLATIDKDGWTLKGWKTKEGKSFENTGTYRTASNLTLYADWVANQYKVTLDPNNGTVSQTEVTVTYDSQYELPTPTRTNYTFLGWYDSSDKKVSSKATWKGTENATYTAKWTNVQNTYVFDAGDGTCDVDSMVIGWEDAYELPTPTAPINKYDVSEGVTFYYSFDGWYLNDTLIPQTGTKWNYSNTGGTFVAKYIIDHIEYGIYPQTHVSDDALIENLNTLTTAESNGWYLYAGNYYAKATAKLYSTSYTFDDGTKITRGTEYWFKCEPINWKVLESNDGEYKLVSSILLDAHCYHSSTDSRTIDGTTIYANNYKYSDIRTWLNDDFYNKAFSLGNSYIQTTEVDNSASTIYHSSNKYACDNTFDKVYLLSYQDYMNTSYFADEVARQCKKKDYARAAGATSSEFYWTRSPYYNDSNYACCILNGGDGISNVSYSYYGVRPALTAKFE